MSESSSSLGDAPPSILLLGRSNSDTLLQPRRDSRDSAEGAQGELSRSQVISLPIFQRGDSMPVFQRDSSLVSEASGGGGANAGNMRAMESLLEILNDNPKEGEAVNEKSQKMTRSDFVTIRPIAKGAFGCVYLVKRKSDGLLYASPPLALIVVVVVVVCVR